MIKTVSEIEETIKHGLKPNEVAFISTRTREIIQMLLDEINNGSKVDTNVGELMSLLSQIKIGKRNGC